MTAISYSLEEKENLTVKLVNNLLIDAFSENASDIHFEPVRGGGATVRYRVGGGLNDIKTLSPAVTSEVISYLKKMASLNPDIHDKPQRGKMFIKTDLISNGLEYDMKIGTLPTVYGERTVISVSKSGRTEESIKGGFEALGFNGKDLENIKKIFDKPFGLMIITGNSGSGKTTTCHGALNYIHKRTCGKANIIAVEDWIEYHMEGIVQVQAEEGKEERGFYDTLKSVMWQSPDVIFVSSVPDGNTAKMISEIALTGHMAIIQMASPDVLHAFMELSSLGIEPYLLASIFEGAVAQRLVRCICKKCKEEYVPREEILKKYFIDNDNVTLYRGKGCKECGGSGYMGRIGIYEIIIPDDEVKEEIALGCNDLKVLFKKKGFNLLRDRAIEYALSGVTTFEEALRVSYT